MGAAKSSQVFPCDDDIEDDIEDDIATLDDTIHSSDVSVYCAPGAYDHWKKQLLLKPLTTTT
jgi:hypothetical protein